MGKAIMIQGCTSSAGKSYLCAALCRILSDEGLRVAPFKAQNMSNNAGVTPAGLEMGRAQIVQARAARVTPDVRMNPVLLKPEGDMRSQVVLLGRAAPELTALGWRERKPALWPHVRRALHSLMEEYDVVVIEGAGSPAEVNLRGSDIVNMRVAREANAAVLLAADIDRGGAFAHLLGTWHCLDAEERALLRGFVLNRFRGDARLLAPAPQWLQEQTGVPTVGVVPWLSVPLPEEDGVSLERAARPGQPVQGFVAIPRLPRIANLDEFAPLGDLARWVTTPAELSGAQAVILPGSKSTVADLAWLRSSGLAGEISRLAAAGVPVLGICGGLQMLGRELSDPEGVEGSDATGLGLLDLATSWASEKTTRETELTDPETGIRLRGYEIHHGQTQAGAGVETLVPGLLWRQGNVRGTYLHGILENPAYLERFLGWAGLPVPARLDSLDARLDAVAAQVKAALDWAFVRGLVC